MGKKFLLYRDALVPIPPLSLLLCRHALRRRSVMKRFIVICTLLSLGCAGKGPSLSSPDSAEFSNLVVVDFAKVIGPTTHKASGVLHSISATEPHDDLVLPLKFKAFRGRVNQQYLLAPGFYDRMKRMGIVHVQAVLSDSHGYTNPIHGWPGDSGDWSHWENVVEEAVKACQERHLEIEYDIWNEPDIEYFWKRDRPTWLETWKRAYRKVRSIDPDAVIVGPSITHLDVEFMTEFLTYGKQNNCLPDILSWHELATAGGETIPENVEKAKELLRSLEIGIGRISLHEIVPRRKQYCPGTTVCYFANVERTTVESACHSCWPDVVANNGGNNSLDGLLTYDTRRPRACWWVYWFYGDMTGQLVGLSITGDTHLNADGLAAFDEQRLQACILIGSYEKEQTVPLQIALENIKHAKGLVKRGRVRVKCHKIPDSETDPLETPILLWDETFRVRGGRITLPISDLKPGESIAIYVLPTPDRS